MESPRITCTRCGYTQELSGELVDPNGDTITAEDWLARSAALGFDTSVCEDCMTEAESADDKSPRMDIG